MGKKEKGKSLDMVELFNELTGSDESDDCFENLLGNHFEKFRVFFNAIQRLSEGSVFTAKCIEHGDVSYVLIEANFDDEDTANDFEECIADDDDTDEIRSFFDVTLETLGEVVHISIYNKLNEEGDIYGNLSDSY